MNRYENEYGCHTPNASKECYDYIVNRMDNENLNWTDSSWHNDLCDSMECTLVETADEHKFIQIMFPNSFIDDDANEFFTTFTIIDEQQEQLVHTSDINKVIDFINKNY